jgi:hypothetical protein
VLHGSQEAEIETEEETKDKIPFKSVLPGTYFLQPGPISHHFPSNNAIKLGTHQGINPLMKSEPEEDSYSNHRSVLPLEWGMDVCSTATACF